MELKSLHFSANARRKIIVKHRVTPEEAERAFMDPDRQVVRRERLLIRGKDELSGKYILIVGDDRKGVLHAATCRQMTDREKASYKKALRRKRG